MVVSKDEAKVEMSGSQMVVWKDVTRVEEMVSNSVQLMVAGLVDGWVVTLVYERGRLLVEQLVLIEAVK